MTFVTVCVPWRLKEHINPDTSVLVGKPPKPHKVLSRFIRFFGTEEVSRSVFHFPPEEIGKEYPYHIMITNILRKYILLS